MKFSCGCGKVRKIRTKFMCWVWEKYAKHMLIPAVGMGEIGKTRIKPLWCAQNMRKVLVVGVQRVCIIHTRSLWRVWEKYAEAHQIPVMDRCGRSAQNTR